MASIFLEPLKKDLDEARRLLNISISCYDKFSLGIITLYNFKLAYSSLAGIEYELQKYTEAVDLYKKAKNLTRDEVVRSQLYLCIGNCYFNQEKYDFAIDSYDKSLQSDKKNYEACYFLGNCYFKIGKQKEAIRKYYYCLQLLEESGSEVPYEILFNLGNALCVDEDYNNAIRYYNKALINSCNEDILFNLGNAYFVSKNFKEALNTYVYCEKVNGYNYQIQILKVRCLLELSTDNQNLERAEKILDDLLKKDGYDINALFLKANLLEKLDKKENAIQLYNVSIILKFS